MAEGGQSRPVQDGDQEYAFSNVKLFKTETLGTGSYGAVCKAKCGELICAAKLLYPVLFEMQPQTPEPGKEHRQPFRRFELECRFLSFINHPNIVQYLGTYRDPDTNAPVLLMELMDESLTHFLESSSGPIPYHVQVNLCYDIAQALAFLHSNGIIHRDLSSNNVLLLGNRAKVTDFGMSKFANITATHVATMTTCPGTPAFMSPEALNEPPVYTEKLDNFSLGVVMVQVVTKQYPKPTDRFQVMQVVDPRFPTRTFQAQVPVPEVKRRHAHISLIDPTHPLLPIAHHCLKDKDVERPSSQQLCQTLGALKKTAMYEEGSQQDKDQLLRAKDELILSQTQELDSKTWQLKLRDEQLQDKEEELYVKETENHDLTEQIEQSTRDNLALQHESEAKERQLRRLNQQLEANEEITVALQHTITQREREVSELQCALSSKDDQIQDISHQLEQVNLRGGLHQQQAAVPQSPAGGKQINLVWKSLPKPHTGMLPVSSTVHDNQVYFSLRGVNRNVIGFNFETRKWCEVPLHPIAKFTLVCVNDMLTTVGGREDGLISGGPSNKVYTLIDNKWLKHFPAMRVKRLEPAAVYANNTLVVAGGSSRQGTLYRPLNDVEVLYTQTKQWLTAASLPSHGLVSPQSAVVYRDHVYITMFFGSKTFQCSRLALIRSTHLQEKVWEEIAHLPVTYSTLVAVNGRLLVIGGMDSQYTPTADIHQYNSTIDSWEVVSRMSTASSNVHAAVLPGNKIMIVRQDEAEIATFE